MVTEAKMSPASKLTVFLQAHPDQIFPLAALANECELNSGDVANGISMMIRQGLPVVRVTRGVYKWTTKPVPVPERVSSAEPGKAFVVEFLGDTNKGMLVRHENLKLYLMTEVTF